MIILTIATMNMLANSQAYEMTPFFFKIADEYLAYTKQIIVRDNNISPSLTKVGDLR